MFPSFKITYGKPNHLANPKVTSQVDKEFENQYMRGPIRVVKKESPPWKENKNGRPNHNSKVVTVLCNLKEMFHRIPYLILHFKDHCNHSTVSVRYSGISLNRFKIFSIIGFSNEGLLYRLMFSFN